MTLLGGVDHLHLITPDLDRLLRFYGAVFDAPTVLDRTEDGLRYALIDVGGGVLVEALERLNGSVQPLPRPKSEPGTRDRVGLSAPSREAFVEARRRVMAAGAGDGRVRDVGFLWTFAFHDPDGTEGEVVWRNPGIPPSPPRPAAPTSRSQPKNSPDTSRLPGGQCPGHTQERERTCPCTG